MVARLRRFFDVRPGEGLPVLLTFLYIASVVASFLLAKPIRNALFLREYGPYALVYVYAAVPVVLWLFLEAYSRVTARFGSRTVTVGTLLFFSANVLAFWYAFRFHRFELLPGVFYVWVNCFGVIAPVQAWSFANSLFDTRQAKRLFGLIGAGASLGAITGGVLARFLVGPVGGTVNMMLVLAGLILLGAVAVSVANTRIRRKGHTRVGRPRTRPLSETLGEIAASPYLRLMAALVFLVAISTQTADFQLSLVADARYTGNAEALTRFFGTFNFVMGSISFVLQLLVTGPMLRRFGVGVTILVLPLSLGFGSVLIFLLPAFWSVLATNAFTQGFRFSIDKATYELLYLPIPSGVRVSLKGAIDIVVNRGADAAGGLVLGLATQGFVMLPGLHLGLRGTAAINVALIAGWAAVAWRLRTEYVTTIRESIRQHRLDTERVSAAGLEKAAAEALRAKLGAPDEADVRYALELLEAQQSRKWQPALRQLLTHAAPDIRRRAMALLRASRDRVVGAEAVRLLGDQDLGVRTEALLYLSREMGVDPLSQIQEFGRFEDYSIRASMAAFLASPGPAQNLVAARALLEAMARATGENGARERAEAARVIALVPHAFLDLLIGLLRDEDEEVARQAVRAARVIAREELIPPLMDALARPELADEVADALARFGNAIVLVIAARLRDEGTPLEARRELPAVLVRIGTREAEQVLVESLLQQDVTLRHRVVASLNKLRLVHPDLRIDPHAIEVLLAAEIAGHYRSYQVLGPLQAQLKEDDPVLQAMHHSMEQEIERIFRIMALLFPHIGLHDAYVGVRSSNPIVRANSLELLDNVLRPELRHVLVPLLDSQVTQAQRIELANRLVGAPLETPEQSIATLLASEDSWLRSCAAYAVGAMQLHALEPDLARLEQSGDPAVQEIAREARQRLAGEAEPTVPQQPPPADMGIDVGAG
jgi:AAA family ATP:ADP antiporter